MFKKWLIEKGIKLLLSAIALGVGIWYVSHSLGGASLSYTSVNNFITQINSNSGTNFENGCFLCMYINELFIVLGNATEMFWNALVGNLWILMALGYGIFIIFHTVQYMREAATSKDVKDLTNATPKFDFKKWFEKVWKTGLRILIAGAALGAIKWGGTDVLNTVTKIIVEPVLYLGTILSEAATGVISGAHYDIINSSATNPLASVLQPFMSVMKNLNTVVLAGAGGGFALMNYAWLGLGGGVFTWLAGLTLVIIFLFIGFDIVFQVLNVLFKLIFIIIFMPLIIAATAFEQVWALAKGVMNSAIKMLIESAVSILKISLKITIIYAVVYFAADTFYPKPADGFTTILPPLLDSKITRKNMDAKTMAVQKVFTTCEQVSLVDGEIDKDKFVSCFNAQKTVVESRYPGAFDFMDDGLDFMLFMIGICFLYFWVVSPKVDSLLKAKKEDKGDFDYGQWLKDFGTTVYNAPSKIVNAVRDKMKEG